MCTWTEDEWDAAFLDDMIPNEFDANASWNGCMFETCGQELAKVTELKKQGKQVWTWVEGDEGDCLVPGFQFVNRIGYIVTNKPAPEGLECIILEGVEA